MERPLASGGGSSSGWLLATKWSHCFVFYFTDDWLLPSSIDWLSLAQPSAWVGGVFVRGSAPNIALNSAACVRLKCSLFYFCFVLCCWLLLLLFQEHCKYLTVQKVSYRCARDAAPVAHCKLCKYYDEKLCQKTYGTKQDKFAKFIIAKGVCVGSGRGAGVIRWQNMRQSMSIKYCQRYFKARSQAKLSYK